MMHTTLLRWFLSLLLVPLLCGCLEYEEIEVRVVAEPAIDRIDLCILSRGIHIRKDSGGVGAKPSKGEIEELLSLRDRVALPMMGWSPWDLTAEIRNEASPDDAERSERARKKLFEFVELEAGSFHRNAEGKLCMYQFVRIHRVPAFVEWVNETLRDEGFWEDVELDGASRDLLDEFLERKADFLAVDGIGLRFRMPWSDEAHQQMIEELRREVLSRADGDRDSDGEDLQQFLRLLLDNRLAMVRHERHTDFYLGTQGGRSGSLRSQGPPTYQPNLLAALEEKDSPVAAMKDQEIVAAFDAFRRRDVKEPEAVLAARKALGVPGGK